MPFSGCVFSLQFQNVEMRQICYTNQKKPDWSTIGSTQSQEDKYNSQKYKMGSQIILPISLVELFVL
jgi:hypothetical protein